MVKAQFWYHEITFMQNAKCKMCRNKRIELFIPLSDAVVSWSNLRLSWVKEVKERTSSATAGNCFAISTFHRISWFNVVWTGALHMFDSIWSQLMKENPVFALKYVKLEKVCRPASVINTCFHSDKIRRRDFWPQFHKTEGFPRLATTQEDVKLARFFVRFWKAWWGLFGIGKSCSSERVFVNTRAGD